MPKEQRRRTPKTCRHCQESFSVTNGNRERYEKRQFCSKACQKAFSEKRRPKCVICGDPVNKHENITCSRACYLEAVRNNFLGKHRVYFYRPADRLIGEFLRMPA